MFDIEKKKNCEDLLCIYYEISFRGLGFNRKIVF